MPDHQIQPHKVTKPIQLVAAWLTGLVLIDAMFLGAAVSLSSETWPHGFLVVAAVINVPIFLSAIFLLQTKFRAELQEDSFYSEYLSKRTSQVIRIDKNLEQDAKIAALELQIHQLKQAAETTTLLKPSDTPSNAIATAVEDWGEWLVAVNGLHPQFNDIVNALETAGIPVETVFGKGAPDSTPSRWVISINLHIPSKLQVALLRTLMQFNFEGFHRWEPRRDAEEYEDVYIGSYGDEPVVRITPKLRELLAGQTAEKSLNAYYRAQSREA